MDVGIPESTAIGLLLIVLAIPVVLFIGAFLIGSVPLGRLIGRLRAPSTIGTVAALIVDTLKGFVPTFVAVVVFRGFLDSPDLPPTSQIFGAVVAAGVLLGHCFSPWLHFRGGKGVATAFGAIFALCWPAGLVAVGVWIAGTLATRYLSAGSLLGSIVAPFAIWFFSGSIPETLFGVFAALVIAVRHRENIGRLRSGTEARMQLIKR